MIENEIQTPNNLPVKYVPAELTPSGHVLLRAIQIPASVEIIKINILFL